MHCQPFSIYLHFPYCSHRCPYCDFNVHVRKQIPEADFTNALLLEAEYKLTMPEWQGRKISTIFLGGGTPSLFSTSSIAQLLMKLEDLWKFEQNIEISIEANPDTITETSLRELRSAGVNRLSIGVQSLSNKFLKILGRNHDCDRAKKAVYAAYQAGFKNVNIDLMFALPDQTLADLKQDLADALALNTEHISYYSLTIESGTPFYEKHLSGSLKTPSNDQTAEMMEEIVSSLNSQGVTQYEISNFSKKGFECRHNQAYWQAKDYLGLGPAAHSAISSYQGKQRTSTRRWSNRSMPERYIENPKNSIAWSETVSGGSLVFESMLLGLRQKDGIEVEDLVENLEIEQKEKFWALIEELRQENFISVREDGNKKVALTKNGLMLADSVTEKFSAILLGNA